MCYRSMAHWTTFGCLPPVGSGARRNAKEHLIWSMCGEGHCQLRTRILRALGPFFLLSSTPSEPRPKLRIDPHQLTGEHISGRIPIPTRTFPRPLLMQLELSALIKMATRAKKIAHLPEVRLLRPTQHHVPAKNSGQENFFSPSCPPAPHMRIRGASLSSIATSTIVRQCVERSQATRYLRHWKPPFPCSPRAAWRPTVTMGERLQLCFI